MKNCTNCGKICCDNENFCSNCGSSTFTQSGPYQAPNMDAYILNEEKDKIDIARICGMVSLVIILLGLIHFSWIPALIGLSKLKSVISLQYSSNFRNAKLLNKIGMIVSIVSIVLTVLLVIVYIVAVFGLGYAAFTTLII